MFSYQLTVLYREETYFFTVLYREETYFFTVLYREKTYSSDFSCLKDDIII